MLSCKNARCVNNAWFISFRSYRLMMVHTAWSEFVTITGNQAGWHMWWRRKTSQSHNNSHRAVKLVWPKATNDCKLVGKAAQGRWLLQTKTHFPVIGNHHPLALIWPRCLAGPHDSVSVPRGAGTHEDLGPMGGWTQKGSWVVPQLKPGNAPRSLWVAQMGRSNSFLAWLIPCELSRRTSSCSIPSLLLHQLWTGGISIQCKLI